MTDHLEGCEKELYHQTLTDHERRINELTEHYHKLDTRTAEQGGLIRSIDGRMTELVKDTTAQTAQLEQMDESNTQQNGKILNKVSLLENTLTDFAQNGAEATRQIRNVKDTVSKLDKSFNDYVSANSGNMARVETIGEVVARMESFLIAVYGEVKGVLKKLLGLGLLILALWSIYHLFPGIKPVILNALSVGSLAE